MYHYLQAVQYFWLGGEERHHVLLERVAFARDLPLGGLETGAPPTLGRGARLTKWR